MRLIKSNIPTDRKNSFFIKVLSGILVFCLLLVSFVFLLIYQNVKKRSLEQSYLAEQDIVSNVSYSASIMQDTASSMLTQLNGDPKLLQLIYSMDTESLSVIQSMQLLQTYTRASSWLDSVYIYCAEEDCICYAYANGNTYQLSFGTLDDFFDAAFVRNLATVSRVTQKPAMRQLRYRSTSSDKTVFSYVLPVRTSLNRYNGFFVANISAERLMQLGYGMANGTERQLLIVDANGQTYTSGMTLLEQKQTDAVIEAVLGGAAESGQMVVQEANAICTWSRSADTDLYFISCISDSAISSQLRALTRWFLLFYLGIVVFAVLISVYLTIRINREYAALQTQYTLSEKRYAENYSYIKHAILRSFFTLRSSDFVIGRQFSDNGIELEQYSGFALFLLQLRQRELSDDNQNMSYRRTHFLLQEQLDKTLPQGTRYELVDMLQGRFLLVCEQPDTADTQTLAQTLCAAFSEAAQFSVSGVWCNGISAVDQLPAAYRTLNERLDLLYFYPAGHFVSRTELDARPAFGKAQAEQIRSEVVQALCTQRFDDAAAALAGFFDAWFEPTADVPYTLDLLIAGVSEYIATFKRAYAVTMEYNPSRFRTEVLRAESSRAVKRLFLDLVQDVSCAFASIDNRSNYIDAIIGYIERNYADPKLNIDALADHVGLSASHIQNIFKAATGSSISAYLRRLRLNKATELLEQTDVPISEIAERTGFGNSNYFYTVFKRHYAVTPSEYRANRLNRADTKEAYNNEIN